MTDNIESINQVSKYCQDLMERLMDSKDMFKSIAEYFNKYPNPQMEKRVVEAFDNLLADDEQL